MQFVIDVVPSSSGSFSLEAADDVRFISGARMFTAAELSDVRADVAAADSVGPSG
jgi:uncharacterized protein (DUF779 family)